MTFQDSPVLGKFTADVSAISRSDARQEEIKAQYERIAELEGMLGECREYFEDCSDVIDGSNGEPAPNREMRMLCAIDEVLS